MLFKLPQEIQDKIFLLLDWDTLSKTRELQSDYVKHRTESYDINHIIQTGNLENLKWLFTEEIFNDIRYSFINCIFNDAIENDKFEIVKWMLYKFKKHPSGLFDFFTFNRAVENGNLEIMKLLLENSCPLNFLVFETATQKGNPEIIQWLCDNGCPK